MARFVLPSDGRASRHPVVECGEELRDLREVPAIKLDERLADPAGDFARARLGVVDRLVAAQTLLPAPTRLLVIECYRPARVQRRYVDEHGAWLAAQHPQWTPDQVRSAVRRHLAGPESEPHVTGATVDVTLCGEDGSHLPLGPLPTLPCSVSVSGAQSAATDQEAANRRALAAALRAVGLVNNPARWWHWSYGDRYWALVTGRPAARYGPIPD